MSIWFFIWLLLSAALLYFLVWSFFILFRQKKTWKAYAEKNDLRFSPGKWSDPPEISGTLDGFTINFFTSEHMREGAKTTRKMTTIEIILPFKLPFDGGFASGEMVPLLKEIDIREEFKPDYQSWNKSYLATADNIPFYQSYMTAERLDALTRLMRIKNSWIILVFRNDISLLRLDTPYPLDSQNKLESAVRLMLKAAESLGISQEEIRVLERTAASTPPPSKSAVIAADDDFGEVGLGLELEEDEQEAAAQEAKENDSWSETEEIDNEDTNKDEEKN